MRILGPIGLLPFLIACSTISVEAPSCAALTGAEIEARFADVLDRAQVQDGARGSAVNLWCRDGRFTSRWVLADGTGGSLGGRWWVEGDLRCVEVDDGLPDDGARRRCVPILACGERITSLNESGEHHGWHVLEPAPCPLD
ncbi:MAG: hypothetical protein NXI30_06035 [bacterium]|nr:hypothetical protein [bacterium]